ncbi:tetratricopeptide repeat protein [Natronomonas sp. EA1]|uniref:tetratricopeptide repeat protein n=1 Tax=Natronomonas sp. EA1 TaxID=3421655 RepID=UPI003EB9BF86
MSGEAAAFIELVARRAEFLELLCEGTYWKRDLIDALDTSRSTANRAVRQLEDAGLVTRTDGGYVATVAGRVALDEHRAYRRTAGELAATTDVLAPIPPDAPFDASAVVGGETVTADEPTPYRPVERLHETVAAADTYHAVLPSLDTARHLRLLYEHVCTDGGTATLVVSTSLFETLRARFPRRMATMADTGRFTLVVGDPPPYGLVRTTHDGDPRVSLVVFSDDGTVSGLLENETPAAVAWADDRIAAVEADGEPATDRVGASRADGPSLDAQGFVHLTRAFFADRPTADPVTAWRAGLDLPAVQTGYAADRTLETEGEPRSLTAALRRRLEAGTDVALVGPPGCGKSTVCKHVACEWYRDDRGDVYYRESGRGDPFDAVETLVETLDHADGRPLVVVEDAVRPQASAAFTAAARLADTDVSFLFDAREGEWTDDGPATGRDLAATDRVEVVTMPRLLGRDCDRLVDRFEETVGIDVPGDELRAAVRDDVDASAPASEAFLLTHRLAMHAAGGDGDPTTLDDDVAAAYGTVVDAGDRAVDAALLVNALNAAGVAVRPDHVRAVAGDSTDRALDALDGHVSFGTREDGRFRTVHGAWSVQFLAHLLDAREADAADRLAAGLHALLDDDRLDVAPETVVATVRVGTEWPKLAPLFDTETPDGLDREATLRCLAARGGMRFAAGAFETARARFERLCAAAPDPLVVDDVDPTHARFYVRGRRGLGFVAERLGDLDAACRHAEAALDAADVLDDERERAASRTLLGTIAFTDGDLTAAADHLDAAIEGYASVGDRRGLAEARIDRGTVAVYAGDLDAGADHLEAGLDLARAVGDRGEAGRALNGLGFVARERGALDDAAEYGRQALATARERGERDAQLATYVNLASIATARGDLETAAGHQRDALELAREVGRPLREGLALAGLSRTHRLRGEVDAAIETAQEAVDVLDPDAEGRVFVDALVALAHAALADDDLAAARDHAVEACDRCDGVDDPDTEIGALRVRGLVALREGAYGTAADRLDASLRLAEETGETLERVRTLRALGDLELARNAPAAAQERYERSAELARDAGATGLALDALDGLVTACEEAGAVAAARDGCTSAIALADADRLADRRERFEARLADLPDPA